MWFRGEDNSDRILEHLSRRFKGNMLEARVICNFTFMVVILLTFAQHPDIIVQNDEIEAIFSTFYAAGIITLAIIWMRFWSPSIMQG